MGVVAVVPARYTSHRFPGKVLAARTGRYLVQHVVEQVRKAASVDQVIVATDDQRVVDAVHSFGGEVRMTRPDHPSGTDRVAEVASELGQENDIVLNVQGDEPEIDPASIDQLIAVLRESGDCSMATLACPFPKAADPSDPNCVKVVLDRKGRALYFSRSCVPFVRDGVDQSLESDPWLLHVGVYAYRQALLREYATLPPTPLEQFERLEQLRVLEHGFAIAVGVVESAPPGIDTPEEYEAFVRRCSDAQHGNEKEPIVKRAMS